MWPAVTFVPAGNPVTFATNVTLADVMLLPDVVVSNVMVTVPLPADSALETGGTSLAGNNVAVNVGFVGVEGDVDDEPHPAAAMADAIASTNKRFIGDQPPLTAISRTYVTG